MLALIPSNVQQGILALIPSSVQQGIQGAAFAGLFSDLRPKSVAFTAALDTFNGFVCSEIIKNIPLEGTPATIMMYSAYAIRFFIARRVIYYLERKKINEDCLEEKYILNYYSLLHELKWVPNAFKISIKLNGILLKYLAISWAVSTLNNPSQLSEGVTFISGMWDKYYNKYY